MGQNKFKYSLLDSKLILPVWELKFNFAGNNLDTTNSE